jgi:hypothetical protein
MTLPARQATACQTTADMDHLAGSAKMGGTLASYGSCRREVAQCHSGERAPKVLYGVWRPPR